MIWDHLKKLGFVPPSLAVIPKVQAYSTQPDPRQAVTFVMFSDWCIPWLEGF